MTDAPGLLAFPNFSEGRDASIVASLGQALSGGAEVLDVNSDPVHNRTAFTLLPNDGDACPAVLEGARAAIELIDMSAHDGDHPAVGALDVAPVIYLNDEARDTARGQALEIADALGDLGVPVFLYGELASVPERRERAYFRSGGPTLLTDRMASGELVPDRGPSVAHPTAGATLVTARKPLAAFNIEFEGMTLAQAKDVAAALRESGGGRPGVRAIALQFGDAETTQVSTNIHDSVSIPLSEVVARARELAEPHAGRIVAAEIVGLVPRAALDRFPEDVPLRGFDRATGVIEERLS